MTQKERLIKLFLSGVPFSNYYLRSMQPAMFQYPARIFEINREGIYHIKSWQDKEDKKLWWYQMEPVAVKQTEIA